MSDFEAQFSQLHVGEKKGDFVYAQIARCLQLVTKPVFNQNGEIMMWSVPNIWSELTALRYDSPEFREKVRMYTFDDNMLIPLRTRSKADMGREIALKKVMDYECILWDPQIGYTMYIVVGSEVERIGRLCVPHNEIPTMARRLDMSLEDQIFEQIYQDEYDEMFSTFTCDGTKLCEELKIWCSYPEYFY
jgi:hypothetical protein